jgi:TrmH family RNA methyltransferase
MIQSTTSFDKKFESVSSLKNPLLREVRKALARGVLTPDGFCAAESFHLLDEAIRSGCRVKAIIAAESAAASVQPHLRGLNGVRALALPDALFRDLASTESAQGVVALVQPPAWKLDDLFRGRSLVVALDGVQDPGNAGAIVRAAEAFGASGAIFVKGSASPFNAKTLRASAGSLFRLPFVTGMDEDAVCKALAGRVDEVLAAMPRGRKTLDQVDLTRRFALIVGGEGRGVSDVLRACAADVRIPTTGVESLNAAMSAVVFLYEAARQRGRRA